MVFLRFLPNGYGVARAMGANPWQIITKVLIPEALSSIVLGITITVINLIGYSAMAEAIGGGGLGDVAIRYGYQRFRADIMLITVVILIVQVQVVQSAGAWRIWNKGLGIVLGFYFLGVFLNLTLTVVPSIDWRGPADIIAVGAAKLQQNQ